MKSSVVDRRSLTTFSLALGMMACAGVLLLPAACVPMVDGGNGMDPCDNVTCEADEVCEEGQCVLVDGGGTGGDAVAGEAFFMANECANCHGADGSGGSGPPSLLGIDSATILTKMDGTVSHVGGTFEATQQDTDDLAAWLATVP